MSRLAAAQPGQVVNLSPVEVQQYLNSGIPLTLLDVRQEPEFRSGHIAGARLIPLGTLPERLYELDSQAPVVVVCQGGHRSAQGAEILAQAGFRSVGNMFGGMQQWPGAVEK